MTTLLTGVNEVLKRANLIQGDSGTLTSLTDSPRQVWIDTAVQAWNETIEELYSTLDLPVPKELAEATITIVSGTRAYVLATYNTLYWPFINETTGQEIYEWKRGYLDLVSTQSIPANFTGQPLYGVIRPTDEYLYLDRIPSSSGDVYKYRYDKDISMSTASATFPCKDIVFRALVPAVTEVFNLNHRKEFAEGLYKMSMGRAARALTGKQMRSSWGKSKAQGPTGIMAPFDG